MEYKLISNELGSALCEQIGHEHYNSVLYLFICGYLKNKGLDNLAKHFETQYQEEYGHGKMIFDLLTDLNYPISIPEVDEIDKQFSTIIDISDTYLSREIDTTNSLNDIKKLAIEEDNPVVEEFMRKMLVQQQAEYEEASTFNDRALLTGGNWMNVFIWDLGVK